MSHGKLFLNYGPMFAQKTTWLVFINLAKKADLGYPCLLINSNIDDREGLEIDGSFSTHNKTLKKLPDGVDALKVSTLVGINVDKYSVIGVDEAQFFGTEEDMNAIIKWVKQGKTVYVSALDGTSERKFFGKTYLLIPYCEAGFLTKSTAADCLKCLKEGRKDVVASFSHKFAGLTESGGPGETVDTGGAEKFMPVCGNCYAELNK